MPYLITTTRNQLLSDWSIFFVIKWASIAWACVHLWHYEWGGFMWCASIAVIAGILGKMNARFWRSAASDKEN